jgi:beta-phosphoglucomutase-like phosphatase (HAD superfamily)
MKQPGARPDGLVFDLDGTLWDTTGTCADAWNRVLARLGIVRPPVWRRMTTPSRVMHRHGFGIFSRALTIADPLSAYISTRG